MEGLDPWLSPDALARRVGAGRTTVQTRIRSWREKGFLRGHLALPNPTLFAAVGLGQNLRVEDPSLRASIFDSLALIDGVSVAFETVGPWIALAHAGDSLSALQRHAKLAARLPGVSESETFPNRLPPLTGDPLTLLDWRFLQALRRSPEMPLKSIAAELGVSARTLTRRQRALVRGNAVFFQLLLDHSRSEGAAADLIVSLRPDAPREPVVQALRKRNRRFLERNRGSGPALPVVQAFVHFDSVGQVEEATRHAASLPGVANVEVVFPLRVHEYASWADDRIAAKLEAASQRVRGR